MYKESEISEPEYEEEWKRTYISVRYKNCSYPGTGTDPDLQSKRVSFH